MKYSFSKEIDNCNVSTFEFRMVGADEATAAAIESAIANVLFPAEEVIEQKLPAIGFHQEEEVEDA